ncbi:MULTISPECIES: YeaC family protein [unclassified Acinetobacter]|uniref:YeaC family protein n=1 Tax=unclassified Acinetobacter TaxID=196816 RepID=UPI0035B80432
MNIEQILKTLNPEIVEKLKTAVEIGKWDNGVALTKEQRQTCMQAVLIWESKHLPENERTGYIDRGSKKEDEHCDSHEQSHDDEFKPIKFH